MLTRANICYNLEKSPYTLDMLYEDQVITYHFSSELYKAKFEERREDNQRVIEDSLSNRFGFKIKSDMIADIRLYSSIEKRGFLISVNGEYRQWLSNITLDGLRMTVSNSHEL